MSRPQRLTHARHGTLTRYNRGCSCLACCDAHNAYAAEYKADPLPRWVDVTPVREHIHRLYDAGYSRGSIAAATGISFGTLRIIDGSQGASQAEGPRRVTTRCRRSNAEAILALEVALPGRYRGLIPAGPTRDLVLRLLKTRTVTEVAEGIGTNKTWLWQLRLPESHPRAMRQVRARRALAVIEYAERVGATFTREEATWLLDTARADRLIDAAGYEKDAVMEAAGISIDTWSQIRSGRPVGDDRALVIARAIGTSVESIFARIAEEAQVA